MRTIDIRGSIITILPVVKGLVSEVERVRGAVEGLSPDVIAVSISKEELATLKQLEGEEEYDLSEVDLLYAELLSKFGEVSLPPPCFLAALQIADERSLPIIPLDMNEELFSATYVTTVRTTDLMKESFFIRRIKRVSFDQSSPTNLAIDWDRRLHRPKGFQILHRMREEHMAGVMSRLARRYSNIFAVVECERAEGVLEILESMHDVK